MTPEVATSTWVFEPTHCKIGFSIAHFGISETEGLFHRFEGSIQTSQDDFVDALVEIAIDVTSIDTLDKQRDAHLLSADFFNAESYPTLTFRSSPLLPNSKGAYKMPGELTMAGITKPVELDLVFGGIVPKDPFGNTKAGFKVTGKINRKDWGLTWNRLLDFGGIAVGEEVTITCNIELLKQ